MGKKDKLYTVTKGNKQMFMGDRTYQNIFDGYGGLSSYGITPEMINNWIIKKDPNYYKIGSPGFYASMENDANNIKGIPPTTISTPALEVESKLSGYAKNGFSSVGGDSSPKDIQGDIKAGQGGPGYAGMIGGAASAVGDIPTGERRGMWDTADPLHHLAGGNESVVGNAMGDAGVALFKTGASSGNPYLMLAGGIAKGLGSAVNALWGTKVDQKKLNAANAGIAAYNNFHSNASNFDEIEGPASQAAVQDPYSGGLFKKGEARRKNERLRRQMVTAKDLAWRSVYNNVDNISKDQINNALSQFFAYGGLLGGALGNEDFNWGLNQLAIAREKDNSVLPQALPTENMEIEQNRIPLANMYGLKAFGGELGTNGTDFTNGLIQINEGGTHETNPLDGVPMGFDDRGIPNLVEEGETVFNDYVFSDRLQVPTMMYNELGLGGSLGKKAMTFAEASKKLAKESEQRPNDPISMDGLRNALAKLAGAQESLREREEEPQEVNTFAKGGYKRRNRITTERYNRKWFEDRAKSLGMDKDALKDFEFTDDVDTNLAKFNDIYKAYQREKARKTYVRSQRQARKNELFDERKGRYKLSDDEGTVYQAKINTDNREGYINAKGDFIDAEAYKALDDEEKKAYRYRKEPKGSRQLDFYGNPVWDIVEGETLDSILDKDNAKYEEGFEWDPKKAEELSYPVEFTHSPTSNLRYAPVFGGFVGLANDLFNSPDYSRADAVINAGQNMRPMMVRPNYNPTYLTYRPMDNWYGFNALAANSRATDRALMNTTNPARNAALLANGYNSILGLGNLYRQGLEYNNALRERVAAHNSGENRTMASLGLQAQMANQNALSQAQRYGLTGIITGNQMKDDIDARRSASISANLGNLVNSIGNIGEEAYDMDRLKWLADTGVLRMPTTAAKGGMLKKKRRGCK